MYLNNDHTYCIIYILYIILKSIRLMKINNSQRLNTIKVTQLYD